MKTYVVMLTLIVNIKDNVFRYNLLFEANV